jgi:hypothetical protein
MGTKLDTRVAIMNHLKGEERSLAWLAKKSKLSYGHLYFVLARKERELTDENKKEINKILGTNF